MVKLHTMVGNLQQHVQKCQENLLEIRNILIPFARKPVFERKDNKKDTILCVDEKEERLKKRKKEIDSVTQKITILLNENMELFEMTNQQGNRKWTNYVNYVDKIIISYLYQTIGCR